MGGCSSVFRYIHNTAARIPESTSPLPAVAIPELPERFRYIWPFSSAITVHASFNTHTEPVSAAHFSAVSAISCWISWIVLPLSRLISPICGVRTTCSPRYWYHCGCAARRFRPSASRISGFFSRAAAVRNHCSLSRLATDVPSPGPITITSHQDRSCSLDS